MSGTLTVTWVSVSLSDWPAVHQPADCVYVEMDPYRDDSRDRSVHKSTDPATIYPEDLTLLARSFGKEERRLVLQLSSFGAQNGNNPDVIETSARRALEPHRLVFRDLVMVDGHMVSLVLCETSP